MLVLTRKPLEQIYIGDNICITVLRVDKASGEVRLGIDAPRDMNIVREELVDQRR